MGNTEQNSYSDELLAEGLRRLRRSSPQGVSPELEHVLLRSFRRGHRRRRTLRFAFAIAVCLAMVSALLWWRLAPLYPFTWVQGRKPPPQQCRNHGKAYSYRKRESQCSPTPMTTAKRSEEHMFQLWRNALGTRSSQTPQTFREQFVGIRILFSVTHWLTPSVSGLVDYPHEFRPQELVG